MARVLLTGCAGFIGSNVLVYLVEKYPENLYVGIDKMSYCSSLKNFQQIQECKNFTFIKADFTNMDFMDFIFNKYKFTDILHFGAYTHVDMSFGNSIVFTQNNVIGTHILLELSVKYKIEKFIHVSTDEVYGCKIHESTEDSILDPTNPYAATKAAAESLVKSYYYSYKLPIIITRGNNVYGEKQFPDKICPKFLTRLFQNQPIQIQGSGQQKRSYLYIQDVCQAFDVIIHKGVFGEIYNISSEDELTVLEVAKKMEKFFNNIKIEFIADRNFNDQRYFINSDKLKALGWYQQINFDQGIELTYNWYKSNLNYF